MKIGFVIPWYGPDISGGAEFECRATALQLKAAGFDVEILTTCVKDFRSDWNVNHYSPGVEVVEGIPVRRFQVPKINRSEFHRINRLLMDGRTVAPVDEETFVKQMVRSDALVKFMQKNERGYIYILIPYMFGTTYWGTLACPQRSILFPCLHDERYAYMGVYKDMFKMARGVIYNARSEKVLAEKLYDLSSDKGVLIGMGMNLDFQADGNRFKSKFSQFGADPYILYAGRKDEGKNIKVLIDYFCAYKKTFGGPLKLVLIGGGQIHIPVEHLNHDVFDLGFVSPQEKWDAYAGALVLCNPSLNESFSIVMMESWLAGAPVLVHERCAVTRDHCVSSQGGLYFKSFEDFIGCLNFFLENHDKRARMARNGAEYVKVNFTWPKVIEKYSNLFDQMEFV